MIGLDIILFNMNDKKVSFNFLDIVKKLQILLGAIIILTVYCLLKIIHQTKNINTILLILVIVLLIPQLYQIYLKIKFNQTDINLLILIAIAIKFYYQNDLLVVINVLMMALYPLIEESIIYYLNYLVSKNKIIFNPVSFIKNRNNLIVEAPTIKASNKIMVYENEYIPVDGQIIDGQAKVLFNHQIYDVKENNRILQGAKIIKGTIALRALKDFSDSFEQKKNEQINLYNTSQSFYSRLLENNTITYSAIIVLVATVVYMITRNTEDLQRIILLSTPFYFLILAKVDLKPILINLANDNYIFKSMSKFERFIKTKTLIFNKNGVISSDHESIKNIHIINQRFSKNEIIALCEKAVDHQTNLYKTIDEYMKNQSIKKIKLKEVKIYPDIKLSIVNYKNYNLLIGSLNTIKKNTDFGHDQLQILSKIESPVLIITTKNDLIGFVEFDHQLLKEFKRSLKNFKSSIKNIVVLSSDHQKSINRLITKLGVKNILHDFNFQQKIDYLENISQLPTTLIDNTLKDNPIKSRVNVYINLNHHYQPTLAGSDLMIVDQNIDDLSQIYLKAKNHFTWFQYSYWTILFLNAILIVLSIKLNFSLLLSIIIQFIYFVLISLALVLYIKKLTSKAI